MIKLSAGALVLGFVAGLLTYMAAKQMEYDMEFWTTEEAGVSRTLSRSLGPGLIGVAVALVAGSFLGIGAQPVNVAIGSLAGAVAGCYASKK